MTVSRGCIELYWDAILEKYDFTKYPEFNNEYTFVFKVTTKKENVISILLPEEVFITDVCINRDYCSILIYVASYKPVKNITFKYIPGSGIKSHAIFLTYY